MDAFFQMLNQPSLRHRLERYVVFLAFVLFFGHLGLIFIGNQFPGFELTRGISGNYLSALYTPFSLILVLEVFLLILALPNSFNYSIRKQYEIISLITIRQVFKDISYFDDFTHLAEQTEDLLRILTDLGGGLLLFFLVGVFHHVSSRRHRPTDSADFRNFVRIKQLTSLLLLVTFLGLSAFSLYDWGSAVSGYLLFDRPFELDLHLIFFEDFYTVMIFADVIIFIASFLYTDRYSILLRNAGFVASTILLRMSLAGDAYYGVLIAAAAIVTGILAQLIQNYFDRLRLDD